MARRLIGLVLVVGSAIGILYLVLNTLNPAAVHQVLRLYGYQGQIAYDSPTGTSYSYHSDLIVTRSPHDDLLDRLRRNNRVEGTRFYQWGGASVNSYPFGRLGAKMTRLGIKLGTKIARKIGKLSRGA